MELFTGKIRTYASRENAVKALEKANAKTGASPRWMIGVTEKGRFFPVVVWSENDAMHTYFYASNGICLI